MNSQNKIPTYFHSKCSGCGWKLRVGVERLGEQVVCRYCGYRSTATDPLLMPVLARIVRRKL